MTFTIEFDLGHKTGLTTEVQAPTTNEAFRKFRAAYPKADMPCIMGRRSR